MPRINTLALLLALAALALTGCRRDPALFELESPRKTGVRFINQVPEAGEFNFLNYISYYNGGGVAAGDVNNDGLPDLYFTSNAGSNRLCQSRHRGGAQRRAPSAFPLVARPEVRRATLAPAVENESMNPRYAELVGRVAEANAGPGVTDPSHRESVREYAVRPTGSLPLQVPPAVQDYLERVARHAHRE